MKFKYGAERPFWVLVNRAGTTWQGWQPVVAEKLHKRCRLMEATKWLKK
ncbi:hypothetical protein [Candidatus Leptofilum sp.]